MESIINFDILDKEKFNLKHKTQTYYKVLNVNNNISQILFVPKTGKTHQLRIVSKKLGCPIIGDNKYNLQPKFINEKLKLNAYKLNFEIKGKNYKKFNGTPMIANTIKILKKSKIFNMVS